MVLKGTKRRWNALRANAFQYHFTSIPFDALFRVFFGILIYWFTPCVYFILIFVQIWYINKFLLVVFCPLIEEFIGLFLMLHKFHYFCSFFSLRIFGMLSHELFRTPPFHYWTWFCCFHFVSFQSHFWFTTAFNLIVNTFAHLIQTINCSENEKF